MKSFLIACILFCCVGTSATAVDYYRSNILGMKLERIEKFRIDEFDYCLAVESEGEVETRTLISRGKEITTWIITRLPEGKSVEVEISGSEKITRERLRGRLIKETVEEEDRLREVRRYIYEGTELVQKEVTGPEGPLYTDYFERTERGRLRRVVREFPGGDTVVSWYSSGAEGPAEEVHTSGDASTRFSYDAGELVLEEQRVGGELVSRIEYFPEERTSRQVDFKTGEVITRTYDQKDRIIREETETETGIDILEYTYRDDLLSTEIHRSRGLVERWEYEYSGGEEKTAFNYYRNKILRKRREFETEGTYRDIIMRDGKPLLIVHYREHVQVETEYLGDDEAPEGEELP